VTSKCYGLHRLAANVHEVRIATSIAVSALGRINLAYYALLRAPSYNVIEV
jgi:hypothetical protein